MHNYQQEACNTFKEHVKLTAHQARLLDWALGIGGESGEILELIKHHIYGAEDLDKVKLAKELGDIIWYISAMATTNEIKLEDIMDLNLLKLKHRHNNGTFDANLNKQRHAAELKLEDTLPYQSLKAKILQTGSKGPLKVILIGPDGAGKTTIGKQLAKELGLHYYKCTFRENNKVQLCHEIFEQEVPMLLDRFYYPDDIVYTEVKGCTMAERLQLNTEYKAVHVMLQKHNIVFLYVHAELDELVKRSTAWEDDYIRTIDLKHIVEQYSAILSLLKEDFNVLTLDTTGLDIESAAYRLKLGSYIDYFKVLTEG